MTELNCNMTYSEWMTSEKIYEKVETSTFCQFWYFFLTLLNGIWSLEWFWTWIQQNRRLFHCSMQYVPNFEDNFTGIFLVFILGKLLQNFQAPLSSSCYQFWRKGRRHCLRLFSFQCALDGDQINFCICWSRTTIITITAIHSKNIMIDVMYVWIIWY